MNAWADPGANGDPFGASPRVAGWYPLEDRPNCLRWWDGQRWVGDEVVREPGWYERPDEPGVRRFWDGRKWTPKIRRRASNCAFALMLALSATGVALVAWGRAVAVSMPLWSYPVEMRGYYCSGEHDAEFMPSWPLWAIWFALVIVGAAAVVTWGRGGRGDRRMAWLAALGVVSVTVLCPLWIWFGAIADCAL